MWRERVLDGPKLTSKGGGVVVVMEKWLQKEHTEKHLRKDKSPILGAPRLRCLLDIKAELRGRRVVKGLEIIRAACTTVRKLRDTN